ncbi:hypothetical protein AB1Y20_015344 [Prymnesium parvum]|uniref:Calmodulin-lysine N-methyltransferase n=1 Tax=Prymnesium parvum TaxID=97485 RepID=A0AB34JY78_PRYPA
MSIPSDARRWRAQLSSGAELRQLYELKTADQVEGIIWPACLVLLHHLEQMDWRGKRVLELGAGTGHLAVGLARLGAHVTATEGPGKGFASLKAWAAQLLSEEPGGGLPLDTDNTRLGTGNSLGGSVDIRELWWGSEFSLHSEGDFDVIIMSELTYDVDCHDALLQTLQSALKPGKVAWQIFVDRPFSLGFMMLLADAGFDVTQIEPKDTLGFDSECELHMHCIHAPNK